MKTVDFHDGGCAVASRTPLADVYTCTLDRRGREEGGESHNVGSYYSTFSTRVLETDGTQTTLEVGKRENIQRTIDYRRWREGRAKEEAAPPSCGGRVTESGTHRECEVFR